MARRISGAFSGEKDTECSNWKGRAIWLGTSDHHAFDAEGGGSGGGAEDEVVADGGDVLIHVLEVAGDGDLFDGVGEFAVFDPEAGGALGVVSGDEVDAEAHGLGDVEAGFYVADDLFGGEGAGGGGGG